MGNSQSSGNNSSSHFKSNFNVRSPSLPTMSTPKLDFNTMWRETFDATMSKTPKISPQILRPASIPQFQHKFKVPKFEMPKFEMPQFKSTTPVLQKFNPVSVTNDCNVNKTKNAIINAVVGGTKGAGMGWLGAASGAGAAAITSVLDDFDTVKTCEQQKLNKNFEIDAKANKAINKTINKAIGAAATATGSDVTSIINKATNKAITHVISAATSSVAESITGRDKGNNPDCNLRKSLIFSNIAGGAVGTAAGSALLSAVTVNPIPISTAMLFGAGGGAIQGYVEAKKEQKICIAKKEKETNATTNSASSPKKP